MLDQMLALFAIVGVFVLLDLAALRWGADSRTSTLLRDRRRDL